MIFLRIGYISLFFGVGMLLINFWGVLEGNRSTALDSAPAEHFRFPGDYPLPFDEALLGLDNLDLSKGELYYTQQANELVSRSLSHIEWFDYDPALYYQTVPFKENFILNLMGRFSGLPFYERYHYTNYRRSIERGIGVCGDASMVLSQILHQAGIKNSIIAYDRHVVVVAYPAGHTSVVADPDFGVFMDIKFDQLKEEMVKVVGLYESHGYGVEESYNTFKIYNQSYVAFDSAFSFIPKRYVFEELSYVFKWLIPLFFSFYGGYQIRR